jgi:hypothetical protein
MDDWEHLRTLVGGDHGLATAVVIDGDGHPHATTVNAGPFDHPVSGAPTVAVVAAGSARKLALLRVRPWMSVTFRVGWDWISADGPVDLVGPDDPLAGVDDVAALLRSVFVSAGGTHDDWDEYDRVMAEERRTVVLVRPARFLANR